MYWLLDRYKKDYLGILGNHTAALDLFYKAFSINPDNIDAYINKGTDLGVLGKNIDALRSIDKGLAIDPNTNNLKIGLQCH